MTLSSSLHATIPPATENPPASPLLAGLNERQREAVLQDGAVLVLAGAGSGKTRVLTTRIARHIQDQGARPEEVTAITFTKKAASEMRERLARLLGKEKADGVTLVTFHALGLQLMRESAVRFDLPQRFGVADESDALSRVRRILRAEGGASKGVRPADIAELIRLAKMVFVEHAASGGLPEGSLLIRYRAGAPDLWGSHLAFRGVDIDRFVARYRAYQQALAQDRTVDYEDLLCLPTLLLVEQGELRRRVAQRCRYLLVDEYQDTDGVQEALLRLLSKENGNLCVVGDDDQSVYSWRQAQVENIRGFPRRNPGSCVVVLDENYRSTPHVLAVSNAIIATQQDPDRHPKQLWTRRTDGAPVVEWTNLSQEREAEALVADLLRERRSMRLGRWGDVMVLYRQNALARPVETALRREGIPYRVVSGVPLHERREVKDALSYLRIVDNPYDLSSFLRAVAIPSRGIGPATVEHIHGLARASGESLLDVCTRASTDQGFRAAQVRALRGFGSLCADVERVARHEGAAAAVHAVIEHTGIRTSLVNALSGHEEAEDGDAGEDVRSRLRDLDEFVFYAEEYTRGRGKRDSLAEFLDDLAVVAADGRLGERPEHEEGEVLLLSVHASKGLEASHVYVIGLEEQVFPVRVRTDPRLTPQENQAREKVQLAEELRLFYVACTRARDRLVLSWARTRSRKGAEPAPMTKSRFLYALPETLYQARNP